MAFNSSISAFYIHQYTILCSSAGSSGTKEELDAYAQKYEDFYYYMRVLENLAQDISSGAILAP